MAKQIIIKTKSEEVLQDLATLVLKNGSKLPWYKMHNSTKYYAELPKCIISTGELNGKYYVHFRSTEKDRVPFLELNSNQGIPEHNYCVGVYKTAMYIAEKGEVCLPDILAELKDFFGKDK